MNSVLPLEMSGGVVQMLFYFVTALAALFTLALTARA